MLHFLGRDRSEAPAHFAVDVNVACSWVKPGALRVLPVKIEPLSDETPAFRSEGFVSRMVSLWVTSSETGFLAEMREPVDIYIVRIPKAGHIEVAIGDAVLRAGPGEALITTAGPGVKLRVAPRSEILNCAIDRQAFIAHQRVVGMEKPRGLCDLQSRALLDTPALKAFLHAANSSLSRDMAGDHLMSSSLFEEMLVVQLVSAWPRRAAPATISDAARTGAVERAIDYINDNLTRPIKLTDIAHASGVGPRTLQKAFRHKLGCSPSQYVIDCRLSAVHRELQIGDPERYISDIAYSWGFVHMSDFTRRYKARFGELPSAARRRD